MGFSDLLCANPFAEGGFFYRLITAFGFKYVFFIAFQYGVNQGFAYGFGNSALSFFFQDKAENGGLGYSPQEAQKTQTASRIPWQIKSVFGIIADAFAIRYFHRKYYLAFATLFGAAGWFIVGVVPADVPKGILILALTGTNLAVAWPDVLVDGSVAMKCQEFPKSAVDLQSLLWGAFAVGAIIQSAAAGFIYEALQNSRPMFFMTFPLPLLLGILALMNWIDDRPDYDAPKKRQKFLRVLFGAFLPSRDQDRVEVDGVDDVIESKNGRKMTESQLDRVTGKLYILALILTAIAIVVSTLANEFDETQAQSWLITWVTCTILIVAALWVFLRSVSVDLASTAIYIFLKGALQPYNYTMSYWARGGENFGFTNCCEIAKSYAEGWNETTFAASDYSTFCYNTTAGKEALYDYDLPRYPDGEDARPCLSESYITYSGLGGYAMMLVGIAIYNKYLSNMSYRAIWAISTIAFFALSWLDVVWLMRYNIDIGIPDEWFNLLGSEILANVVDRLDSMPFFILAAKLCPPGVESTLFAMMMGLSNFGSDMGGYLGTVIEIQLGVTFPDAKNLDTFLYIRNFMKLTALVMIPILVPRGGPTDPSIYASEDKDVEGSDEMKDAMMVAAFTEDVASTKRISVRK